MTTRHPSRAPMSSDGRPLVGWQEPEQEPEQERVARRYRAGRCVACAAPRCYRTTALCRACWDAGQRYCPECRAMVDAADYARGSRGSQGMCRACYRQRDAAYQRRYYARANGHRTPRAQLRAASVARATDMWALRARGWTSAEIGRRYGMAAESARSYLSQRPPSLRQLVERHGLTHGQIAELLGVSVSTVQRRIRQEETSDA